MYECYIEVKTLNSKYIMVNYSLIIKSLRAIKGLINKINKFLLNNIIIILLNKIK